MFSKDLTQHWNKAEATFTCHLCYSPATLNRGKRLYFHSSSEFCDHLRETHCIKEGGSFVCLYGPNDVCPSLPIEGVSEVDYKDHVSKVHIGGLSSLERPFNTDTEAGSPESKWMILNSSVNLAALLNNPRLTKRETDFFTKTWGEGFGKVATLSSIPSIHIDYFEDFIRNISAKRKKYTAVNKKLPPKKLPEILTLKLEHHGHTAPKIFFSSDFCLTDRATFDFVLPWDSISNKRTQHDYLQRQCPTSPHSKQQQQHHFSSNPFHQQGALDVQQSHHKQQEQRQPFEKKLSQSSKLLQEKLSHYLDSVEMQLCRQICLKSESFFQTMLSHNTLNGYLENLCKSVHFLREKMRKIREAMVDLPLSILRKTMLKNHYKDLLQKLNLMATVQQTQPTIQLLLSTNDFSGSLDLISTTHEVLSQELSGLHCFRHLGPQLLELKNVIVRMIEEEYTGFLTNYLNQPIDHFQLTLPISSPSSIFATPFTLSDGCKPMDQDKLVLIALGLFRAKSSDYVGVLFTESCTTVRTLIKQTVIEVISSLELNDVDTKLTAQLRLLDHSQWLLMLSKLFYVLVVVIIRVKSITDILTLISTKLTYPSIGTEDTEHVTSDRMTLACVDQQCLDINKGDSTYNNTGAAHAYVGSYKSMEEQGVAFKGAPHQMEHTLLEFMSECDPVMLIDAGAPPTTTNPFNHPNAFDHDSSVCATTSTTNTTTNINTSNDLTRSADKCSNDVEEVSEGNIDINNKHEQSKNSDFDTKVEDFVADGRLHAKRGSSPCRLQCTAESQGEEDDGAASEVDGLGRYHCGTMSWKGEGERVQGGNELEQDQKWKHNVTLMMKDCEPILSAAESSKVRNQLQETLLQVFEFANQRSFKLFAVRDKDDYLVRLSVKEFLELSRCVEWFDREGERMVGRKCSPLLRGLLQTQAVKFVNKFHEEKKNKLCLILDNERWKQADVPREFQRLVDHIISSGQMSFPPKVSEPDNGGGEYLTVAEEKYIVVGTVLMLLKLMLEYCEFAEQLPCMASDVLNKLVELLKNFNSRTCQLILGAGALQLVGLKTINTINLGLASRCLQLVVFFLPQIRNHFKARLPPSTSASTSATSKQQSLKQLDHLAKDYNDHISEISVKMVSIMDQVLLKLISKYDLKSLSSSSPPSATFEAISKQTLRFIEATTDLLPRHQMEAITSQFHHNFVLNLGKHLTSAGFSLKDAHTSKCIEKDLKHYSSVIRQVAGFQDFKITLSDIMHS